MAAKRVCVLCGAIDTDARAIEGKGLKLKRRPGGEFQCADDCQWADRVGVDRMGMLERKRVYDLAVKNRRVILLTIKSRAYGNVVSATASNNEFWGNTCQRCGQAGIPLMGVGRDRQCVDPFACLLADNPHRQAALI